MNPFRNAIEKDYCNTVDWFQGKGVYGGLVFAQIIHQIQEFTKFPIRRLNIDMCAPVAAQVCEIGIQESRRGMNSHFFLITMSQQGKVVAHGTAVCGGDRARDLEVHQATIPQSPPPKTNGIPQHPLMPAFTQHFEYWPTLGDMPFSGSNKLLTGGWIRSRHDTTLDQPMIAALLDAWWPSMSLGLERPRPMGTVSIAIDFLWTDTVLDATPCFLENQSLEVSAGYSIEHNRLWRSDGALLAIAQQNIVLIQ